MKKYADEVEMNQKIEKKVDSSKVPFSFGIDSQGRYGYIKQGSNMVTPFKIMQKVGSVNIARAYNTVDLSAYPGLTNSDIFLIPKSIQIAQTKTTTTTETASIERSFSNGILTIRREAFDGNITVTIPCDVYIYY